MRTQTNYVMRISKKRNIKFIEIYKCKYLKNGDKLIRFTDDGEMNIISTYVKSVDTKIDSNTKIESGCVGDKFLKENKL